MQIVFWIALGLILYTYFGFPLLLVLRGLRRRPVAESPITPSVSLVIIAHNEASGIAAKLDNVLALDYPSDKLEVIVGSDGSDDGTNEIVQNYRKRGVKLFAFPRQGKIPALNAAVKQAHGDVLVFSDANSMYQLDALRHIVRPLADPSVGAVAGNQCYTSSSGNAASFGERMYWSFDRWLKTVQSQAGSVTSSTGAIHAIRRELFQPVPSGVCDDFVISTRAIAQGYRLAFAPAAIAKEPVAPTDGAEFSRKVRVIVRGLTALWAVKELFNPLRHGFYSLQILSHKLLRWCVGALLVVLLASSLALLQEGWIYQCLTTAQIAFYGLAAAGFATRGTRLRSFKAFKLLAVPYFFCLANIAATLAWFRLARGTRLDRWDSQRQESLAGGAPHAS